MSRDSQNIQGEILGELLHELRQGCGLGASFFRAAAARREMAETDIQALEIVERNGSVSAGTLADLMGLTTGTVAGILNRLEKAELVQRERDRSDGRRVIVTPAPGLNDGSRADALFASIETAWKKLAERCTEEQLAFLLEFLTQSNAITRQEIMRLREAPAGEGEIFSAPLSDLASGRLIFPNGISRLSLRADEDRTHLYQASFEGPVPNVVAREGIVTIRYPRLSGEGDWKQRQAVVSLGVMLPWQIVIQGGASEITALLGDLSLASFEIKGGLSSLHLELPQPTNHVPIRISGGASQIVIVRPANVAVRLHLKGWASALRFDDQTWSSVGNNVQLKSPGFEPAAPGFDIEITGSAGQLTLTSGDTKFIHMAEKKS